MTLGNTPSTVSPASIGRHGLGCWRRGFYRVPVSWASRPARLGLLIEASGPTPIDRLAFVLPVCPLACQLGYSDGRWSRSRPRLRRLLRHLRAGCRDCGQQIFGFAERLAECRNLGLGKGLRGLLSQTRCRRRWALPSLPSPRAPLYRTERESLLKSGVWP